MRYLTEMRNDNAMKEYADNEMTAIQKRKILDYVDKRIANFSPENTIKKDDLK